MKILIRSLFKKQRNMGIFYLSAQCTLHKYFAITIKGKEQA